jgi:hypothetical protein
MAFLRYFEKYSTAYGSIAKFYIVIEGMPLAEDSIFGGGVALANKTELLKISLGITSTPSLVVWRGGNLVKYAGVHACNLGLYDLVGG